jgi:hypothetical protein
MKNYRVWTCTDHAGTAVSVVVAETPAKAIKLLATKLTELKLSPEYFTLQELYVDGPAVRVLRRQRKAKV